VIHQRFAVEFDRRTVGIAVRLPGGFMFYASDLHQTPEIIMTAYTSHLQAGRDVRSRRDRVADLVGRYPNVSDKDRREILDFMRNGRHLDIGLLTANEKIRSKLDRFMHDHKSHFGVTAREVAAVVAGIGVMLATLWLLWGALT
jgi:hypothetical protein